MTLAELRESVGKLKKVSGLECNLFDEKLLPASFLDTRVRFVVKAGECK